MLSFFVFDLSPYDFSFAIYKTSEILEYSSPNCQLNSLRMTKAVLSPSVSFKIRSSKVEEKLDSNLYEKTGIGVKGLEELSDTG